MENVQSYPCPHCGYNPATDLGSEYALPLKTILAGKYLVGKVLGQGGFGITYIGWDLALEHKVAIKEYYPSGQVSRAPGASELSWYTTESSRQAREDGMQMFLKEARKMSKVDRTPNVVRVRDVFQENNTAYIVMDYVEGETLKACLRKTGPLSWEQAEKIFLPVLQAMEQVHKAGLIHRDLSPDNIMLTPDGDVWILDLGAAKDLQKNGGVSSMQVAKGGFSPPEQYFQQGLTGPYTDVYALAATMYYALTGKVPVPAIDRMNKDTMNWDALKAGVPENVVRALRGAMSLQYRERPQSMGEFAAQLAKKSSVLKKSIQRPAVIAVSAVVAVCLLVAAVGVMSGTKKDTPKEADSISANLLSADSAEADGVCRLSVASDLELLRSHPNGNFVLTQDILINGTDFEAISSFSGTLDGNGYWIKGLNANTKTNGGSILFDTIAAGAVVKDLGLEIRASATGAIEPQISGLCSSNQGTISGCTINSNVSGLRSYSPITASNTGTVTTCKINIQADSCQSIWGILGSNEGTVKDCHVAINANSGGIDALVERNYGGSVEFCYATVTAEGCTFFSGLASQSYAPFKNCTVSGEIFSSREDNCYWNGTANEGYGSEIVNCTLSVTDKRTGEKLPIAPSYVNATAAAIADSGPGTGTQEDPYKISTAADLERLRSEPEAFFVLTQNIDLGGASFDPIPEFNGTLDGNNYTVSGLSPNFRKGENFWNGALFVSLTNNAVVKNLCVRCSLTSNKEKSYGAGITVYNEGLIQGCAVELEASGCYALGGITQNNMYSGKVQDCTAAVVARDCKFVGGIGEYQAGTISGCQAAIALTDITSMGGIAYANAGTIENSTASGTVTTKYNNGILAGGVGENMSSGTVSQCTASVTSSGKTLPVIG